MEDFLVLISDLKVVGWFWVLSAVQHSPVAYQENEVNKAEHDKPDGHPEEKPKTESLVNDWEQRGSQKHGNPADNIQRR